MQFTLYYSANPNSVCIHLHGLELVHLPATINSFFSDDQQFITDISLIPGIIQVRASNTSYELQISKHPNITWDSVFMKILGILRDRFAPGAPITHEMMRDLPRCADRKLVSGDFTCPSRPKHRQPKLVQTFRT